jgi:hypothetical protein
MLQDFKIVERFISKAVNKMFSKIVNLKTPCIIPANMRRV